VITDDGQVILTRDGGRSWRQVYTKRAAGQGRAGKGQRWRGIGLEPSGSARLRFDPFDEKRRYACMFDFGLIRSADRGRSWIKGKPGCPWGLATYDIAADPARRGVLYGGMSAVHDIPYWAYVKAWRTKDYKGGVCRSDDHGESWTPIFRGGPCTSVALDPRSPVRSRTLYVTSYARGLYKSTDGGATWKEKSKGLVRNGNRHVYQVRLAANADLYCLVTGCRVGKDTGSTDSWVPGGLFRSTDGADTWVPVNRKLEWCWPIDFALHPTDARTIYVAARRAPGFPEGGIYRTTDGGANWKRVREETGCDGCFSVAIHPDRPDVVYACTMGNGLWRSVDRGETWEDVRGVPFMFIIRVLFDPRDTSVMYVCTTGSGVWRGPAF
jgi:photosystem II stability/assembly factor-like uncharacterized protein